MEKTKSDEVRTVGEVQERGGSPTSPVKCDTCGAAPGEPCVYTGTEAVRYMLHRSRRALIG